MSREWNWAQFCGTNSTDIEVWVGEDFGHCFEQLAITCPTHILFATISAYYTAVFGRTRDLLHDHIPKPCAVTLRFLVALLVAMAPMIQILVHYLMEEDVPATVDLLTNGIVTMTWLIHSSTVWKLQYAYVVRIPLRGPLTLLFSFFLVLASFIVHIQTIARLQFVQTSVHNNEWEQYFAYCQAGLLVIYTLTLFKSKKPISQPYLRIDGHGEMDRLMSSGQTSYGLISYDELTQTYNDVGIFGKMFFTWVKPLLARGSREAIRNAGDLICVPVSLNVNRIRERTLDILYGREKSARNVYVNDYDFNSSLPSNKSMDTWANSDESSDEGHSSREDAAPKSVTQRTLLSTLNKEFGWHYYPLALLKILADLAAFASPVLLNYLIHYIENRSEPERNGYIYACGLLVATMVQAFSNNQCGFHCTMVGLKVRAAVVTTVYHKTLSVSSVSLGKFSSGEIVNFMSTDCDRIVNFCPTFHNLWSLPLQVALSLYLLYQQVGLAFLAGLCFAVLVIPLNRWIAVKIAVLSERMMGEKDARVKVMNEVLRGIRVVKYYTLEQYFTEKLQGLRTLELKSLAGRKYLDALCVYFWATTPVLISILTFSTYSLMGNTVTAAKVFTSLAVFNILTMPLNAFPWVINGFMEAWVSLKRLERFLGLRDVDWPSYYSNEMSRVIHDDTIIHIDQASFSWHHAKPETRDSADGPKPKPETTAADTTKPEVQPVKAPSLNDITLEVRQGQFIGVIGRVGSGKSSLLAAILAEMDRSRGRIEVSGLQTGFGFCAQEPWVQQGTIRENIVCGSVYNMVRYAAVIDACALQTDLDAFPAGDMTDVGEQGVTLSGGQKARVGLARAVYQDKEIYLLDDPFSAVDAHVAQQIYTRCIMGMLKQRTRIVATHHVQWLNNADWLIVLEDGKIAQSGPPEEILGDSNLARQFSAMEEELPSEEATPTEPSANQETRLVKEEEQESGSVRYAVYRSYWRAVGKLLSFLVLLFVLLMQASRNANDWWLSYWVTHAHHSTNHSPPTSSHYDVIDAPWTNQLPWMNLTSSEDNVEFYLMVYGILAAVNSVLTFFRAFLFAYGGVCAARVLHNRLLNRILKAPVHFFDATPLGRIINRFSSDLYAIDDSLPFMLNIFLAQSFSLIGVLVITCYGLPWVLVLLVPLGFLYYIIQRYYRCTSREVKRIVSVVQSPIYAHFSETLNGLATIRAFRISDKFSRQNEWKYEQYQRASYSLAAASSWFDICLQMIGVAMVTGVAFIAVLEHHFRYVSSGLVGLAISYALSVTGLLNGVVQSFTETEKQMVSVERAQQYITDLPIEKQNSFLDVPPFWPLQGSVEFDRVILRYKHGNTNALDVVSFEIRPGEKVGIVGRTGSGKSSLFQALYRIVELQSGTITIDAINIAYVKLNELRSRLAIIPQDPFLFSGTIRENLDPHQAYSDSAVWSVLAKCRLTMLVDRSGGLDGQVSEGGKHFSVGQRQLMCLARALLSRAKILCLDEATASIDRQTDTLIQSTIREELYDLTVLTIAHRISTIMDYDRVLVMNGGKVVEFAPPELLAQRKNSVFANLVRDSQT